MNAPDPHRLPSTIARDDEHLLVAAAQAGDAGAFEELVNRYEGKIFRLTRNITGNHEDAEDAMQDAFLKAYDEALMRLRKRRPNQFSLDEPVEGGNDLMPRELEDWGPTPEQKYAQTEIESIVSELIGPA